MYRIYRLLYDSYTKMQLIQQYQQIGNINKHIMATSPIQMMWFIR